MDIEDFNFEDFFNADLSILEEDSPQKKNKIKEDFPLSEQELFPILAVRNMVMFPEIIIPITAAREQSKKLLEEAYQKKELVGVITQKNSGMENPQEVQDLYNVGTLVRVVKIINLPDGNTTAITKGLARFEIREISEKSPYLKATIKKLKDSPTKNKEEYEAVVENIKTTALNIGRIDNSTPTAVSFSISNMTNRDEILNFVACNYNFSVEEKQKLLEEKNLLKRAMKCYELLLNEFNKVELRNQIHKKTNKELDKNQREYFLNQQIRTIQEELGGGIESDAEELVQKVKNKKWNPEVEEHFQKEIKRLKRLNPHSPDYNVQRNYLDFFTDLPWNEYSKDVFDLSKAEKTLNKAHFGLEDIKKRILEYIAVLKLKNDMKAPILLLVGPPGVGKTSLGRSVADALGRKYGRISLGGLHDESEIRGHRKTYIGAMAGRILQNIKKIGVSNPVIVLDEIDKLGQSMHGDPSSALLEVLDPEQNNAFYDNYLELGYDLSKVLFIATANSTSTIQAPLLDRMEIIDISGYTLEEKIEIAKRHLIKKQQEANGLTSSSFKIGAEELKHIIEAHTAESGVRTLEKRISAIARWVALQIAMEKKFTAKISIEKIDEILGVPRPKNISEPNETPGVVTGLAWTRIGGDILFIESISSNGSGKLSMTGNLGNVMKESATIALEYIKAKHEVLGIDEEVISKKNIHIHIPEGATPKDGPSAGIAMLTSMVSCLKNQKIKSHLAMTGEITLRGKVLPVGGIKEKLLAAVRAGIQEVILCEANRKDVEEINPEYLTPLNIHFVTQMQEVIDLALEK